MTAWARVRDAYELMALATFEEVLSMTLFDNTQVRYLFFKKKG